MSAHIDEAKKAIRSRVWDLLVRERVADPGVHGYIPAFVGAGAAADTTVAAADVTGAAADATGAGTAGAELDDGVGVAEGAKVAACACRENTSKTTRIPAAINAPSTRKLPQTRSTRARSPSIP